jgi:predicted phosphodiesterase
MRIAVLADIHGNHLALDAVLADLEWRGGADRIVNLGDCVSGPLWPAETMERLDRLNAVTVRGNHDRVVAERSPEAMIASDRFAFDALAPDQREWLGALPIRASPTHGVMACHATPSHDETYLIEEVQHGRLVRGRVDAIAHRLGEVGPSRIIVCGHSHRPDLVRLPSGVMILNPGSVGCPAYDDPSDPAHISEAGSPHARYALLDLDGEDQVRVEFTAVSYASEDAAQQAEANGRLDWALALRTGFMRG